MLLLLSFLSACAATHSGEIAGVPGFNPVMLDGSTYAIDANEAVVRHRVQPIVPRNAVRMSDNTAECRFHVMIDESGTPLTATVTACTPGCEDASRAALMQWRWRPVRIDGQAKKADFDVNFLYRLSGE